MQLRPREFRGHPERSAGFASRSHHGIEGPCERPPPGIYRLPILPEQNAHRFQPRRIYCVMEFRQLGRSGLKVPALSFGTGTLGGGTEFFRAWGASDVAEPPA